MGDAHLRGAFLGRGVEPALPAQPGEGADRSLGRVRPADADRLRPRPRALPRRGRQGRRPGRAHRRHAPALRRHPAGRGQHLDDHQRHRDVAVRPLRLAGPGAGRGAGRRLARGRREARRHHAERHHQGVPLPRHLRLPARAEPAPDHRHGGLDGRQRAAGGTPPTSAATTSRRPAPRRCRRWPTPCARPSPCWTPSATPGRCRRTGWATSWPASPSSSTPACGSSRRCARCARSPSCGTRSPATATGWPTRSTAGSATACRSTRSG